MYHMVQKGLVSNGSVARRGGSHGQGLARDGVDAATTWLIEELRAARLPDLRATKNLKQDIHHVNQHYTLRVALKPIFQAARSISDQNLRAARSSRKSLAGGLMPKRYRNIDIWLNFFTP